MKLASRESFILDPDHRDENRQCGDEQEDQREAQTQLIEHDHAVEAARWNARPTHPHPETSSACARQSGERKTARHPTLRRAREGVHQHDHDADSADDDLRQNQAEINVRLRQNLKSEW